MSFEISFDDWLRDALVTPKPDEVKGYSFNLYELDPSKEAQFGVELIGTGSFDLEDTDWACDEVWEPKQRLLVIPLQFSGKEWEGCLAKIRNLVVSQLESNSRAATVLKQANGIGIGFVDGDLDVLWPA